MKTDYNFHTITSMENGDYVPTPQSFNSIQIFVRPMHVMGNTLALLINGIDVEPNGNSIEGRVDDVLKFSRAGNITIRKLVVDIGGLQAENAIDMNNGCENIYIEECYVREGLFNSLTIKGGGRLVHIKHLFIYPGQTQHKRKPHCDIELGGWSDQNFNRTSSITFGSVQRQDGMPVRIRVGHATKPYIYDSASKVKYQHIMSLLLKIYVRFRIMIVR